MRVAVSSRGIAGLASTALLVVVLLVLHSPQPATLAAPTGSLPAQGGGLPAGYQDYDVVAVLGTPHLYLVRSGRVQWLGDTRAAARQPINWGRRHEVSAAQLAAWRAAGLLGDPILSFPLVRQDPPPPGVECCPIYLVKQETEELRPRLFWIRSIRDVELFGMGESNYGRFVAEAPQFEAAYGYDVDTLSRSDLAPVAIPAAATPTVPPVLATALARYQTTPLLIAITATPAPSMDGDSGLLTLTPTATATAMAGVPTATATVAAGVPDERFGVVIAGLEQSRLSADEVRTIMDTVGVRWATNVPMDRPADLPPGYHVAQVLPARDRPTVAQLRARTATNPGAYWLLDNEPNVSQMGNLTPAEYAEALHHYATVLPQADPTARLVGPNVLNFDYTCYGCPGFTLGQFWIDQLRSEYQARYGQEPPFDVWALHTYDLDWRPGHQPHVDWQVQARQLVRFREYLDAVPALRGRPIWLTEFASLWGFGGFDFAADGRLTPAGRPYQTEAMTLFLQQLVGWLESNAARYNIERWFVFATHRYQDSWATEPNGMRLMAGRRPVSPLTPMGEAYRELALSSS